MKEKPPGYFSYMLRLWQTGREGEATWRASLEDPHTGERCGFASLEELFSFLKRRTGLLSDGKEPS
jgi:hypothetical protein